MCKFMIRIAILPATAALVKCGRVTRLFMFAFRCKRVTLLVLHAVCIDSCGAPPLTISYSFGISYDNPVTPGYLAVTVVTRTCNLHTK